MGTPVILETPELLDLKEILAILEQPDLRVQMATLEILVQLGHKVQMGTPVILVLLARKVILETPELLDLKEILAILEQPDLRVQMETPVIPVQLVRKVKLEILVQLVRRATLETLELLVHKATLETLELRDLRAIPVTQDLLGQKVIKAIRVIKVIRVHQAQMELPATLEPPGLMVKLETPVQLVRKEILEQPDHKQTPGQLDLKATQETRAQPVLKVIKALQARPAIQNGQLWEITFTAIIPAMLGSGRKSRRQPFKSSDPWRWEMPIISRQANIRSHSGDGVFMLLETFQLRSEKRQLPILWMKPS